MDNPTNTVAAEKAILGAALTDTSAIRWASEHITHEDFSDYRLGQLWHLLHTKWKAGEPTDVVSIDATARHEIKGLTTPALFDLVDASPVTGSAAYWAEQVAEGAKRRRLIEMATRARQNALEGDLSEALTVAKRDLAEVGTAPGRKIEAKMLARVLEETDQYDWLIPNILERRDRVIFTGGEGGGKTTMIRQLIVMSAAGLHPFTLDRMDPVRVLMIDAENSETQWRRATRRLVENASRGLDESVAERIPLACVPRIDITKERDLSAIHDLVDEHQPDMIGIGPLYKLVPRAIQSDDDAAPLIAALDSLRDKGCALVMEAHAGHTQSAMGQRDLRPRGSSALLGWPEFGIGLRLDVDYPAYKDEQKYRKVDLTRWRGDRDLREWPKHVYSGNHWPWTVEEYHRGMTGNQHF